LTLAELRLADCPAMSSLDGLLAARPERLALLDLSSSPLVTSFEALEPVCRSHLLTLNLRDTPLRRGFESRDAYARACFSALPQVALSLRTLDFDIIPPGTRPNEDGKRFKDSTTRKQQLEKRHLLSTKLEAPDPEAVRNKPCACGSGVKFKMCCENKPVAPSAAASVKRHRRSSVAESSGAATSRMPVVAKKPQPSKRVIELTPADEGETLPVKRKVAEVISANARDDDQDDDDADIALVVQSVKKNNDADIFSGLGKW